MAENQDKKEQNESKEDGVEKKSLIPPEKIYDEYILIAEDSPPNRAILEHYLKKLSFGTLSCKNGKEAWELMEKETTKNIIAVYSDIMMPEMNGIELLKSIRSSEKYKELPVTLITAVPSKDLVKEAKELNVNNFLIKPMDNEKILSSLKKLFPSKKLKMSPAAA